MESKKLITKSDLNKVAIKSAFVQASFNYERMQSGGWVFTLSPALKKIYANDKEGLSKSLKVHMEFFNTHPMLVSFIAGIVIAMEEGKEALEMIRSIKIATMGPLGGIGDALFWFTLLPITAGIGASIALGEDGTSGNVLGPILFFIMFNIVHLGIRFWLTHYSYRLGVSAVAKLTENTQKISKAASIVGVTVIGALIATYIRLELPFNAMVAGTQIHLQQEIIDPIMPKLLPLAYAMSMFFLLKKGRHPITLIGITILFGILITLTNMGIEHIAGN